MRLLAVVLACWFGLFVSGCGGGSSSGSNSPSTSPSPTTIDLTGTWVGTWTPTPGQQGPSNPNRVTWVVTQNGNNATGAVTFVGGLVFNGTLSGTLAGGSLSLTVTAPAGQVSDGTGKGFPTCSLSGTGTSTAGSDTISGTLAITGSSCPFGSQSAGALSLTKQTSANSLTGSWQGTLSRSGGLAKFNVTWVATQSGETVSGPITLSQGTITLAGTMNGNFPDLGHTSLALHIQVDAGNASSTLPNCSFFTDTIPSATFSNATYTSRPFQAHFSSTGGSVGCSPLVSGPSGFVNEDGELLTLTK